LPCSFYNIIDNLVVNKPSYPEHYAISSTLPDFGNFTCVKQKEGTPPPFLTPALPQIGLVAHDWLGVDPEVRSICSWPTPQTGNQRIEDCLQTKYGRIPIGLFDILRLVLISCNIVF
jgi:hypothetical protein